MTLSNNKKDCESIKYLMPFYVKGTLSNSEREEFERALIDCPELNDELKRWQAISTVYTEIEEKLPQPSPLIYSKIAQKIKKKEKVSLSERLLASLERLIPRRLSFALIVVQLLIIITLGIYAINLKTEYKTLSAPSTVNESMIRINVVFKENASEGEMRRLLTQINGKIIDGPFASGLYVIGITSNERVEDALDKLKKNNIVIMAERAY